MIEKITNLVTRFRKADGSETDSAPVAANTRTLILPEPVIESTEGDEETTAVSADDFPDMPHDYVSLHKLAEKHLKGEKPGPDGRYTPYQAELRRRYFKSMQGQKVVEICGNADRISRGRHISTAEKNRLDRISELERALSKGEWLPMMPERVIPEAYLNYLATYEALEKIKALRPALAAYEREVLKAFAFHSPRARMEEHQSSLATRPPENIRQEILSEEKLLSSKHFQTLVGLKRADLSTQFNETVKPKLLDFIKSAHQFVTELKADAIETEKYFFEVNGNGTARQETTISRQFDKYLSELRAVCERIENPNPLGIVHVGCHVPSSETELQTLFAVPILPPSLD